MNRSERILVVDDERTIVFALRSYFVRDGHVVDCAASSAEALRLLETNSYGVAIVDMQLHGAADRGGLNVAAYIRQQSPSTVVIVLTALETAESDQRAAEAGVHSLLRKPTPLAHVADVAFELVRNRTAMAQA